MPETTPARGYVVPTATDPDDVPYYVKSVVEQVEDKALHHTDATAKRVHVVTGLTGTTDASGYVTFNHGAPFTPRHVQVQISRNAVSLAYLISAEVIGATQVTARFGAWNTTNVLASASLGNAAINLVCWE